MPNSYQILLFYKYIDINDPELFATQQRAWCDELNLKGRTIVASEGINSTLEGSLKDTQEYIRRMTSKTGFNNIHWKRSTSNGDSFPKLSIKVRDEIVSTHLEIKTNLVHIEKSLENTLVQNNYIPGFILTKNSILLT